MAKEKKKSVVSISLKSFVAAVVILLVLMIISYFLTMVVPAGEFDRTTNAAGQEIIVDGTYHATEGDMTVGKFLLSPILVLTGSDSVTLIAIIIFLLVIGATFNALDHSGTLKYMLLKIVDKFKDKKQYNEIFRKTNIVKNIAFHFIEWKFPLDVLKSDFKVMLI